MFEGVRFEPRSTESFEKRVERLRKNMIAGNASCTSSKWIIVLDKDGNFLFNTYVGSFARKIGVKSNDVLKAIQKGSLLKGQYFVDEDFI